MAENRDIQAAEAVEALGGGVVICRNKLHTFGTDAFLLAHFSMPKKDEMACDLGTGCGIIPMLWARKGLPASVWGVDIQESAVRLFQKSIDLSETDCRLVPLCADLRGLPQEMPFGQFHLVSCNPPYQGENTGILSDSPSDRIARHEVNCRIEDVCAAAQRLLKFGGRFCLCMRPERLADTICALRAHQLEPKRFRFVAKEAGSAPWLFLLEARRGGNPFLKVEPTLYLYENGKVSPEFAEIYR